MLLAVPRSKEVMVICDAGGSLENKSGTQFGFQSRSLKAVYYLRKAGYTKVLHVSGGTSQWFREGLPTEEGSEGAVSLVEAGPVGSTGTRAGTSSKRGSAGTKAGTSSKRGSAVEKVRGNGTKGSSEASTTGTTGSSGLRLPELPALPKLALPKLPERVPVGTRSLRKSR
jgi:hypothetical protein